MRALSRPLTSYEDLRIVAEQVLESRGVAAPRMATLDGLLELLGIAEKHHVSGGGAGRRFH